MTHYQYGRYIAGIYRASQKYWKMQLVDTDLRPVDFQILISLRHHDGSSQEDLVHWMFIDKSVVARAVKHLIEGGYVTRKVNEQDRRAYQLFRTEKAIAFDPEMERILNEWEGIILEALPEDEQEHLGDLLKGVFMHTGSTVRRIRQED